MFLGKSYLACFLLIRKCSTKKSSFSYDQWHSLFGQLTAKEYSVLTPFYFQLFLGVGGKLLYSPKNQYLLLKGNCLLLVYKIIIFMPIHFFGLAMVHDVNNQNKERISVCMLPRKVGGIMNINIIFLHARKRHGNINYTQRG